MWCHTGSVRDFKELHLLYLGANSSRNYILISFWIMSLLDPLDKNVDIMIRLFTVYQLSNDFRQREYFEIPSAQIRLAESS